MSSVVTSVLRSLLASAACTLVCLLAPLPARAAVLVCEATVEGRGREAATELEARKSALAEWQAQAGATFTWRLASNKGIVCVKSANGNMLCKASGHPCALHQVPPDRPLKRLMPSAPGQGT